MKVVVEAVVLRNASALVGAENILSEEIHVIYWAFQNLAALQDIVQLVSEYILLMTVTLKEMLYHLVE